MSSIVRALCARHGVEGSLLTALEAAAAAEGAPVAQDLRRLARDHRLSSAVVLGTASFYDFLAPAHRGRRGYVCAGGAALASRSRASSSPVPRRRAMQITSSATVTKGTRARSPTAGCSRSTRTA